MSLVIENLSVSYGVINAVKGISFYVNDGEIVTLIGSNGAGKTTTLRTISGLEQAESGSIVYNGTNITKMPGQKIVAQGIAQVPEGRRVFSNLSVLDNLMMGANLRKGRHQIKEDLKSVYARFPILEERKYQLGATLSGGEQQMLAMGRALMSKTKMILFDEPSMGLAPIVVEEVFNTIQYINQQGVTVLLVEQNAHQALKIAHRAYVLETGSIVKEGNAQDLLHDPSIVEAYLGS